jgi:CBS-domain-containing membrane protein
MNKGIYEMKTRDSMTRQTDTIQATESVQDAIETMVSLDLSALPVMNERQECIGVLTKTDILRHTAALERLEESRAPRDLAALFFGIELGELTQTKVKSIMTDRVISVRQDEPLTAVAQLMLRHEIHHVPVCDDQRHVVGMISSMDLVKAI